MSARTLLRCLSLLIVTSVASRSAHADIQWSAGLTSMSISKCLAGRFKAEGKAVAALLRCHAKAASVNAATDPACLDTALTKMMAAFAKLEGKLACLTTGDGVTRAADAASFASAIDATVGHASKCDGIKSAAVGKYVATNMSCYAKAASKTGLVARDCVMKSDEKFGDAYYKTAGQLGCTDPLPSPNLSTRGPANMFTDAEACLLDADNSGCKRPCEATTGGFCWFLGDTDYDYASCLDTCSQAHRPYDPATETYAAASLANCTAVMNDLGIAGVAGPIDPSVAGLYDLGCVYDGAISLDTESAPGSFFPPNPRACACQ